MSEGPGREHRSLRPAARLPGKGDPVLLAVRLRGLVDGGHVVLAETVAFARATGVDPRKFLETIEGGPLGLPYAQMKGAMMIEEDFPTSFPAKLARKDAALVLEAATARDLDLAVASAVAARFDDAIGAGHGDEDMAAVYEATKPER